MKLSLLVPAIGLALSAPLFVAHDARACGGCYHKASETETTVVTGHRMVLSVSTTQTVLWDQIEYDGDPSEFAWVLPVKRGARVELATDAWFETLDAATTATVVGPELHCAPAPGVRGSGCGSVSDAAVLGAVASDESVRGLPAEVVTVVHHGTVGPYETVTLATDTPGALNTWLDGHGYAVDADIQPIIDAYIAEDFDFIALRLQPGQGVRAMKPVRVVMEGASPTLPLRMVAAGTGASVGIKLFVITEGRFATKNFPGATLSEDELTWDHLTDESNFTALRKSALAADKGRTWLTAYAKPGALLSPVRNPTSGGQVAYLTGMGSSAPTIAQAYIDQAQKNGEVNASQCSFSPGLFAASGLVVIDPCPPGATDPAQCAEASDDQLDARKLACGDADDLAVALVGLHPRDVWVTRLEAFLPRAALATDLELEPAAAQSPVENWLSPRTILHEAEACRKGIDSAAAPALLGDSGRGGKPPRGSAFALFAAGVALFAAARRLVKPAGARAGS
jgi:hypothetical protein